MTLDPSIDQSRAPGADRERLSRLQGYLAADAGNDALRQEIFDLALSCGRREVADQQVTWALSQDPASFCWRHRLALLDLAQGQSKEALLILKSLIDEGQTDPAIIFNWAYAQFLQGQYEAALDGVQALVDPSSPVFANTLSLALRCLHRLHSLDAAIALLDSFESIEPGAQSLGVGSLIALDHGALPRVERWAARALSVDPQQHEAQVALGSLLVARRDVDAALRCLTTAAERHPLDGRTLSALGMAQLLAMQSRQAFDTFCVAAERMPDHIGTWHGLAWASLLQRDLSHARHAFDKALLLNRGFGESHGGLAVVEAMNGEREHAQQSIVRALRLDPLCLSARYAEAVLNGDVADPARFDRLARRVLGMRRDAEGRSLAETVLDYQASGERQNVRLGQTVRNSKSSSAMD